MRWSTSQRIEFIETRLFWEGKISRKDLINYFDISVPQATKDFKLYSELAPENIQYDTSAKQYIASLDFNPVFTSPSSESYFSHLLSGTMEKNENVFLCGAVPPHYKGPDIDRVIETHILKTILKCIRNNNSIEILYQSMRSPEPAWRRFSPHAFGYDGFRWHVRALCHKDKKYKDFNLGRILKTGKDERFDFDHSNDFLWHNTVTFTIGPHQDLPIQHKKCIEYDYGMTDGRKIFEVKAAFVFYINKRFGFTKDHDKKKCWEQQIVLLNRNDIDNKVEVLKNISEKKINDVFSNY